jgi:predicted transcriptional regulator
MHLKPQDTLLALKYWSLQQSNSDSTVRDIAESIGISASEVSKGTKPLMAARLLVEHNARSRLGMACLWWRHRGCFNSSVL